MRWPGSHRNEPCWVSIDHQSTAVQEAELREVPAWAGLQIQGIYGDQGISGAKGRRHPPALDSLLRSDNKLLRPPASSARPSAWRSKPAAGALGHQPSLRVVDSYNHKLRRRP